MVTVTAETQRRMWQGPKSLGYIQMETGISMGDIKILKRTNEHGDKGQAVQSHRLAGKRQKKKV